MRLILKEDIDNFELADKSKDEFTINAPLDIEVNEPVEEDDSLFIDTTDEKLNSFITSDALNELRDILLELPEEPRLLLLDNKVIVIERSDENNESFLYCLGNDDEELSLIKMPMSLDEILANDIIIQYTPANISDVHDRVMDLFMRELTSDNDITEEPEEIEEPEIEEPIDDEEVITDEENEITA